MTKKGYRTHTLAITGTVALRLTGRSSQRAMVHLDDDIEGGRDLPPVHITYEIIEGRLTAIVTVLLKDGRTYKLQIDKESVKQSAFDEQRIPKLPNPSLS